jgi:hypothetical protein
METTLQMLKTHPIKPEIDMARLATAITELHVCAQACITCADACMGEKEVQSLVACVRTNLDCADVCYATAAILSRITRTPSETLRSILDACTRICGICAGECGKHADMHEHCRVCADICRSCENACRELLR